MRYLIVSDIHANLEALTAVLSDAEGKYDAVVCCGDLVGYNPDPSAVVDWTAKACTAVIRGNHDKAISGIDDLEWFNPVAQVSARWTQTKLNEEQTQYLRALPQGPAHVGGFEIIHGAPLDEDEYILSPETAADSLAALTANVAFFGHTHLQGGYFDKRRRLGAIGRVRHDEKELTLELDPDTRYLLNPGSVGQPRDSDARAAYALYDTTVRLIQFRRVPYDVEVTLEKIRAAGLPDVLGLRLLRGQ